MKCQLCESSSSNLKLCSGCEMVMYCSVKCQHEDWKQHKPICTVRKASSDSIQLKRFDGYREGYAYIAGDIHFDGTIVLSQSLEVTLCNGRANDDDDRFDISIGQIGHCVYGIIRVKLFNMKIVRRLVKDIPELKLCKVKRFALLGDCRQVWMILRT